MGSFLSTPEWKFDFVLYSLVVYVVIPGLVVLQIVLAFQAGRYPPEADSIGIPIFGLMISGVFFFPVYLLGLLALIHDYPGKLSVIHWNPDRKVRSWFVTVLVGVLVGLIGWGTLIAWAGSYFETLMGILLDGLAIHFLLVLRPLLIELSFTRKVWIYVGSAGGYVGTLATAVVGLLLYLA